MFNTFKILKENLINNIKQVKSKNPNSKICAMVKANAYGVGLEQVVPILEEFVDYFGVACFFEAQKVRNLSSKNILITGALEKDKVNLDFSYACGSIDEIKFLTLLDLPIKVHLKVNSGMNRYGFKQIKEFKQAILLIKKSKIQLKGIFTHFATADDFVNEQMKKFAQFIKTAKRLGVNAIIHTDNSFANENYNHGLDMIRIGFNLYNRTSDLYNSVVEIGSRVVNVCSVKKGEHVGYGNVGVCNKKRKIAIVPVGYADGFDAKYIGLNLDVGGKQCQVVNVCMDCFMLDITKTKIKKGDSVFILNKTNSLNKYANFINSSEYEIMTKFSNIRANREIV